MKSIRVSRCALSLVVVITLVLPNSAIAQQLGPKEGIGTGLGAILGGVIGSQVGRGSVLGGVAGAVIGGLIGNRIGAALDEQDRRSLEQITRATMSSGSSRSFRNKKTGVRGTTRVVNNSRNASGQACRTVQQEVVLRDGSLSRDTVTGCRGQNGWVV